MPIASLSATRPLLNGRFAEAAVGGVLIGFLFEWTVRVTTPTTDVTAHGDAWEFNAPLPSRWVFTAKQFVPMDTGHSLNALYSSSALPAQFTVTGYAGTVAAGTPIFAGTGTPTSAEINAPMDLATQGFEIQGNGTPTTGV